MIGSSAAFLLYFSATPHNIALQVKTHKVGSSSTELSWTIIAVTCKHPILHTLTSIFGIQRRPMRDWMPELPDLQRLMMPGFRQSQKKKVSGTRVKHWIKACHDIMWYCIAEIDWNHFFMSLPDHERKEATIDILLARKRASLSSLACRKG